MTKVTDEMVQRALAECGGWASCTSTRGLRADMRAALEAALAEPTPEEIPVSEEMYAACVDIENGFRQRWNSNSERRAFLAAIFRAMESVRRKGEGEGQKPHEHVWISTGDSCSGGAGQPSTSEAHYKCACGATRKIITIGGK